MNTEGRKIFGWKLPLYPTVDAQDAGEFIDKLAEGNGGTVTAEQLLEASREKGAVLHDCFEWSDSDAAEKYRLGQAKKIFSNLRVVRVETKVIRTEVHAVIVDRDSLDMEVNTVEAENSIPVPVRAFLNTAVDGKRAYMETEKVLSDEELRENALKAVKDDIRNVVNKYRGLVGLADILEELVAELRGAEDGRHAGREPEEAQAG